MPYNQVYDVRGNHDTFDSGSRCGPRDHYCTYSARAAAANASTAAAVPNDRLPGEGRRHEEMVAGGPVGRLFLDEVYDAPHGIGGGVQKEESAQLGDDLSGGGSGGEDREAASQQGGVGLQGREQEHQQDPHADGELGDGGGHGGGCPVAVLVGVDASLSPGMRSPLNFLGECTGDNMPRASLCVVCLCKRAHHVAVTTSAVCATTCRRALVQRWVTALGHRAEDVVTLDS